MKKTAAVSIIFLLSFALANAQEKQYADNSIARLSFLTGNTYIQKAADLGYEEGIINMPIAEGDRVWVRVQATGTHEGEWDLFGALLPPTGRSVTLNMVFIWRLEDGKLAEGWEVDSDAGDDLFE